MNGSFYLLPKIKEVNLKIIIILFLLVIGYFFIIISRPVKNIKVVRKEKDILCSFDQSIAVDNINRFVEDNHISETIVATIENHNKDKDSECITLDVQDESDDEEQIKELLLQEEHDNKKE